ncbi:LysR family transcriptional regulator [Neorhizobium huautlense]|uniref:LysR family transcriptional regulator n=1 Tax=Neorhizobium huautlense TaxID=67774 RepID=UPI000CF98206|nr:LysR family transcriptional regulator [Neorhizobium huautlense]
MDFRSIDLNLLLVLDAMFRLRSATLVARELLISQPTVSFSLRKLREYYEDELFIRTAAGMQPTPRMSELADPVARMIGLVNEEILKTQTFDPAQSARSFVINMSDIGEIAFGPKLLKRLQAFAPGARIEIKTLTPDALTEALSLQKVDLAIGYHPELSGSNIMVQSLFEHPFVCLVRADHPAIHAELTLDLYRNADHIALVGEGHAQTHFEMMIRKTGIERNIAFQTPYFMNVPFLIRETNLVATVPKAIPYMFKEIGGLRVFKPPIELPLIPVKQYWHRSVQKDPAQIWLRRTVGELFLNRDPSLSLPLESLFEMGRGRSKQRYK